jgi:DNA-binding MarR family transcriptional regulator
MEPDLDAGPDPDVVEVADVLRVSVGLLRRRLRQVKAATGDVTLPESAALARLDRGGPATSSELARLEQISPQSMGATLGGLEARGLVARRPDPDDGRRAVLYLTPAGQAVLRDRRNESTQRIAQALAAAFTAAEHRQLLVAARLLERLAEDIQSPDRDG